jgi:two-component system, OmpR family, response regulator
MAQIHILIVDSDPVAALVSTRGLQRLLAPDVQVTTAPSVDAAWRHCLRKPIDLLIIDPNPHTQASTALITMLRADYPAVAVLVFPAYDTPRLRKQMRALGVQHYIAKPVELRQLATTVRLLFETPLAPSDQQRTCYSPSDTDLYSRR